MKQFKFDINGEKYEVDVQSIEGDVAEVLVNGNLYKVNIEGGAEIVSLPKSEAVKPAAPAPVKATPTEPKAAPTPATSGGKKLKAPLPGSILKINIEVGQAFKEGDVLLVMESMKMENNITAETPGTVAKIVTSVGEAVMQDDILLEYN